MIRWRDTAAAAQPGRFLVLFCWLLDLVPMFGCCVDDFRITAGGLVFIRRDW